MIKVFAIAATIALCCLTGCGEKSGDFDSLAKDGLAAYEKADYNEAINLLGRALHLKPSDRDALYNISMAFERVNLVDSALAYLHRAEVLYPTDYEVNKELFRLCTQIKDYECALSAVRMMIANGDNEMMFWIPLADLNYFLGKYNLAMKYYKLLINDNPREGRYRWNLSECLARLQHPDEAVAVLKKAIEDLGDSPVVFSQIAINYVTMKEYDQAEIYYRKAIKFDPKNVSLWINLAHCLQDQNSKEKKEEALAIYKLYMIDTPEVFKIDSLIKALEKELENM